MVIKHVFLAAALLLSGCAAVLSDPKEEEEGMQDIETKISIEDTDVYMYARNEVLEGSKKVPLILYMCATACDPETQPVESGFPDLAQKEDLIVISPDYNNVATYSETDRLAALVQSISQEYPIDTTRIYSLGFSNGGAASVALTSEHPELFAGIAAYGWMVDLRNKENGYEMPFQVVQGTNEFTIKDNNGYPAVMKDEQQAIHSLLAYNHMIDESEKADYEKTPYWGYEPSSIHEGMKWTISDYRKEGYQNPFAQFLLADGADHVPHHEEASYSWSFLSHFSRSENGTIIED